MVTQRFLDRGRILSACVAYTGRTLSGYTAFPRQGSHSEHVHQSLVLCAISRAFCTFGLYRASGRGVLYDNYRGICNLVMKGQFWTVILFEFFTTCSRWLLCHVRCPCILSSVLDVHLINYDAI